MPSMIEEIEQEIMSFIVHDVREESDEAPMPEDVRLLSGLLDSFGLMSLIGFLEDRYHLVIGNDQVVKANFESVRALARFVHAKLEERESAPEVAEDDEVSAAVDRRGT